jgi:spermidine synthase
VIIIDLPDPASEVLAKLYSREFYQQARRRLAKDGVMAAQATSPYFFHQSFWTINATMQGAGLAVVPYHAKVPSFGNWGFMVAAHHPLNVSRLKISVPTRYIDAAVAQQLFAFDQDLQPENRDYPASTFYNPVVLHAYQREKRLLERD